MGLFWLLGSGVLTPSGILYAQGSVASPDQNIKGDGGIVRLLYSEFGTNSYPAYIIKHFGLDRQHGIDVQLIPAATNQARSMALQGHNAELATIDWTEIARLRAAGIDVSGVGPFMRWGADFTVVAMDSPIRTIGDLRGKRFGTSSRFSMNFAGINALAKKVYRLDLEKSVTVQEGAMPLLRGLLENGQLDASEMFNSLTPGLLTNGKFRVLQKISDMIGPLGVPDVPYLYYAADMQYAKSKPENIRAFLAAYRDAIQILMTNDQVWLDRGRDLKMSDDVSVLFRDAARTDLRLTLDETTEGDIRTVFRGLIDALESDNLIGLKELPPKLVTLEYQR